MVLAPPTALWVSPVSDLGGVARHLLDVATHGIPEWRVVFLTPPGPLAVALQQRGAAVVAGDLGPAAGLRASLATLRHVVGRLRPSIVHTHLAYADLAAALAWPMAGSVAGPMAGSGRRGGDRVRLVSTEHGIAVGDLVYHGSAAAARGMALAHRMRLRRFSALVAVSEATARAVATAWGATDVHVVRNGVDPVDHPPGRPGLRVLSLARLAPEKRIDRLLDAFAALSARHPDARLTIAGEGPAEAALRRQVTRLRLTGLVDLPGHLDPASALAEADVVAQLSVWENASYTLLDAAARGLGVVASPVGGNPEMLPSSCLVEPGDTDAVADTLEVQGLKPAQRPALTGWPTVDEMTAGIAAVYAMALDGARSLR